MYILELTLLLIITQFWILDANVHEYFNYSIGNLDLYCPNGLNEISFYDFYFFVQENGWLRALLAINLSKMSYSRLTMPMRSVHTNGMRFADSVLDVHRCFRDKFYISNFFVLLDA